MVKDSGLWDKDITCAPVFFIVVGTISLPIHYQKSGTINKSLFYLKSVLSGLPTKSTPSSLCYQVGLS